MTQKLNYRVIALSLLIALVTSYVICIVSDLLFGWTMYEIWAPLLPGFVWPVTVGGFMIGLLWLVAYSLYIPAILVLPYNFLIQGSSTAVES
jgi:hypothetical protein